MNMMIMMMMMSYLSAEMSFSYATLSIEFGRDRPREPPRLDRCSKWLPSTICRDCFDPSNV